MSYRGEEQWRPQGHDFPLQWPSTCTVMSVKRTAGGPATRASQTAREIAGSMRAVHIRAKMIPFV